MAQGLLPPFITTTNDYTPINGIKVVVPNDNADLSYLGVDTPCRALIFTASGNVVITCADGSDVTLPISANWFGVWYIRAKRIKATGTTISPGNIFACY